MSKKGANKMKEIKDGCWGLVIGILAAIFFVMVTTVAVEFFTGIWPLGYALSVVAVFFIAYRMWEKETATAVGVIIGGFLMVVFLCSMLT